MLKRIFTIVVTSVLGICMTYGQINTILVTVMQDGGKIEDNYFNISKKPKVKFDAKGNLKMTFGNETASVAEFPMAYGVKMSVETYNLSSPANNKRAVIVPDYGFVTFSSVFRTEVPEGVEVYASTMYPADNSLVSTGSVLPPNTGFYIKAAPGVYYFPYSEETPVNVGRTGLTPSPVSLYTGGYVFGCENGKLGYYHAYNPVTEPGTALLASSYYLIMSNSSFPFINEAALAIKEKEMTDAEDVMYNLQGVRVDKNYKGIVVKKGKKNYNK